MGGWCSLCLRRAYHPRCAEDLELGDPNDQVESSTFRDRYYRAGFYNFDSDCEEEEWLDDDFDDDEYTALSSERRNQIRMRH